jgi:hypothetical protein
MQPGKDRFGSDGIRLSAAMARIWMWVVEIGQRRIGNTGTQRHVRAPGFVTADSRALCVAEIFDLPFDQVQRVDAADCLMRRARLFTLRVGQAFERLEEASPRVALIRRTG